MTPAQLEKRDPTNVTTQKRELRTLLREKYGIETTDLDAIGRTGLLRIIDTCDFLENNLPPNSLAK